MSDRIKLVKVAKKDMDKINFSEPINFTKVPREMIISPLEIRVDSIDKRLSCIINASKHLVENERFPVIVKKQTILNYVDFWKEDFRKNYNLAVEKKDKYVKKVLKNFFMQYELASRLIKNSTEEDNLILMI